MPRSVSVTVGNLGTTGTIDLLGSDGVSGQDEAIGQLTFAGQVPTLIQSSGTATPGSLLLGTSGGTAVAITANHDSTTGAHVDVISCAHDARTPVQVSPSLIPATD